MASTSQFAPAKAKAPSQSSGVRILLTGTFLLLAVGLLIGLFATSIFQGYVRDQLTSRLDGLAITRSDSFESVLDNSIEKAMLVNSSGGIQRNLSRLWLEPGNVPALQNLQQDVDILMQNGFASVRLVAPDGRVLAADGSSTELPLQTIRLIAPIDVQLLWKNGFIIRTTEKLYDAGRQHIGTIVLEDSLPDLTRIYLKRRPIGSSYDSFTCGRNAEGLVSCFPSLLTQQVIRLAPLSNRAKLPVDFALEGRSGVRTATDYRGQPVLAAFTPVGSYGLATIAKIDEEDLNAPARNLIENVAFAIVGLLLVGAVVLNARIRPLVNQLTDAELAANAATRLAMEREAKIQAVVENANDGIVTMGSDGIIRSMNPAGAAIFGHIPSSLVGQHFTVLFPERHRSVAHAVFDEYKKIDSASPSKRQSNLMTGLHASGQELFFELGTNQINLHDEELFIGLIHDVTESRKMQQALADSEKRLRTITDNLPALIAYVNSEQEYEFANVTYEKWFDKPREAIVGKSVKDLMGDNYSTIDRHVQNALNGKTATYKTAALVSSCPSCPQHGIVSYLPDKAANGAVKGYYVLGIDVSAQKLAEEKLDKERELLQTILATINVGVVACDASGTLTLFNRATREFHGLPHHELPAEQWSSYYRLYNSDGITPLVMEEVPLFKALKGETVRDAQMVIQSSTGRMRQISASGQQLKNSKGDLLGAVVVMSDVTALKEKEELLKRLARHDALTGLPNRNFFDQRLTEAILRCERHGTCMALMFLDIDRFKSVNDTHGHHGGDLLLKAFSRRLLDSVRKTDTVARLAGDEFVIILEDLHSTGEATVVADKILRAMKPQIDIGTASLHLSTSIGITINWCGDADPEILLRQADEALYAAKAAGRGCYRLSNVLQYPT